MTDHEYRVAEYDAFGPWILEVTETHPLPPLFIPRYRDEGDSLMRVKIPRNIERRNATPDMDLYDYVIGLYANRAYVLERVGNDVKETTIPYSEIEGMDNLVDLLSGTLSIFYGGRTFVIPYNAVSEPIVNGMMRIMRDRYIGKTYPKLKSPYEDAVKEIKEVIFVNLLSKARVKDEGFSIAAVQPSIKARNVPGSIRQWALHALFGKRMTGSVHLANGREALILGRGRPFKTRVDVVYSRSYCYIPLEKLRAVVLEKDGSYGNLLKFSMKTGNHSFTYYFEETNNEARDYCGNLDAIIRG